jgi:hypothetical protein
MMNTALCFSCDKLIRLKKSIHLLYMRLEIRKDVLFINALAYTAIARVLVFVSSRKLKRQYFAVRGY